MASPFSVFRRNRKVSMAVLGVVVMVGFVVVPALLQMQQFATGDANNPVVLQWSGGQLTASELDSKRMTRRSVLKFIQELQEDARKKDPDVQLNASVGIPNTNHPTSVVQTMLLAEKARDMGIVVSDQAIADYLADITEGVLTPSDVRAAKNDALGTKWTEERLYDALREELLAQKLRQMVFTATTVTTPAAAWEYHNRMERQVTAEFVPFAVDDFVKQITTEPTDQEVEDLYEKHKGDYPVPDSPDPGFKRRARADFQYFVADYNKFLQEAKKKVTREQIERYYEDNKNSFRIDEEPPAETEPVDPDDPRQAKPTPPVPPADDAAPAEEEDAALPPKEEEEEAEPEGEPGVQVEVGEAGEQAADEEPVEEAPADDQPEDGLPPVDDKPAVEADDPDADKPPPGDDDLTAPPERAPKYKPLAEVEEDIRRQLASEPAEKRLQAAMDAARDALRDYRDALVLHETDPDNSPDPGTFDYQAIAKKHGLSSGDTGLIDALDLYLDKELELGQSYELDDDFRGNFRQQQIPFTALAFDESVRRYYPIESQLQGREKVFLSWQVKSEPARVPELDEIREKVVEAWKREEARKLAKEEAEKFAAEVNGKKPLAEQVDSDQKVLTPPPFTYFVPISLWMFRLQGQQPQLETIEGIEDGGSDVIKKRVLAMPVGTVDVAENAAKSVYYVVRLAGDEGDEGTRKNFMQTIVDNPLDGPPPELRYIGYNDQLALFQDWNEQIDKDFAVEWVDKEYLERSSGGE